MANLYLVEKQIKLSADVSNRLSHLAQIYQVSEGQIIEKGLDILSSLTDFTGEHPNRSPALFGKPIPLPPTYDNRQSDIQTQNTSRNHHQNHKNVPGRKSAKKSARKSNKFIKTPLDRLTYRINGHAMDLHSKLGPGYRENTYHRDLEVRFDKDGLCYESEPWLEIYDSDDSQILIGYYIPDFIVEKKVIVEIKALPYLDNSHIAQVIGYLAMTNCEVGLLINFGTRSMKPRPVLPPEKITEHRVNRQWLFVPDWLKEED